MALNFRTEDNRRIFLLGVVIIAIGIVFAVVSAVRYLTYEKVTATVIDTHITYSTDDEGVKAQYMADIRYFCGGREYTVRTDKLEGTGSKKGLESKLGQEVQIYCSRSNPEHITTMEEMLVFPLVSVFSGLFFSAMGLFIKFPEQ